MRLRLSIATLAILLVGGLSVAPAATAAPAHIGKTRHVMRTGTYDTLSGVSCALASHCLLTGGYRDSSHVARPLAEYWNGTTVRLVSPKGLRGYFGSVSCTSTTFCLTAANTTTAIWNGKHWTWSAGMFVGSPISCASNIFCEASASIWNGKTWHGYSYAQPGGPGITAFIAGASCRRPHFCMATGYWVFNSETSWTVNMLTEVWNGSGWSLINPPSGQQGLLNTVSCVSPTDCVTTGSFLNSPKLFAARWNGHNWKMSTLPGTYLQASPACCWSDGATGPQGISCPTATSCMVVGNYANPPGSSPRIDVAIVWNGRAWRLTKVPGPGGVESVSCGAANQCIAVGAPGVTTLAKLWNGKTWRVLKTINP